jgi:hypothetical protein
MYGFARVARAEDGAGAEGDGGGDNDSSEKEHKMNVQSKTLYGILGGAAGHRPGGGVPRPDVAALTGRDSIAYSPVAMYLFGWAMVWGFLTALSRYTAGLEGIAVWDVVERGPNYLAPAALVYIVYKKMYSAAPATRAKKVPGAPAPTH